MSEITCSEFEILLADHFDGALDVSQNTAFEAHRDGCATCAELAMAAAGALDFMERAPRVEVPPALLNRILLDVAVAANSGALKPSWFVRLLGPRAAFVLQPRFAMGLAMAVLSVTMAGRFWNAAENGMYRSWDRAVKSYETLQVVSEVQTQLEEWARERSPDNTIPEDAGHRPRGAENK